LEPIVSGHLLQATVTPYRAESWKFSLVFNLCKRPRQIIERKLDNKVL